MKEDRDENDKTEQRGKNEVDRGQRIGKIKKKRWIKKEMEEKWKRNGKGRRKKMPRRRKGRIGKAE